MTERHGLNNALADASSEVQIKVESLRASVESKVNGSAIEKKSVIGGKGRKKGTNPRISFCLDTDELKAPRAGAGG